MRRVAIISTRPGTSGHLRTELAETLGPSVAVQALSLEEGLPEVLEADLVLVTGRGWTAEVIRHMKPGAEMLVTLRTIRRRDWESVMALPARTRVLVVHTDQDAALELTGLFYEMGGGHLELLPYHPGDPVPPNVDLALTSGTPQVIPPHITRVLNIGVRAIDAVTMLEVMTRLDLLDDGGNARLLKWMAETIPRSQGLRSAIGWLAQLRHQHEVVLDHVQDAVIACDAGGRIRFFNRQAEAMFEQRAGSVVGRLATDVLPPLDFQAALSQADRRTDRLIQVGRSEVMVTYEPLREGEEVSGAVATLRPVRDIWTAEERLRREAAGRGHRARYTFDDIAGESPALQVVLEQARRAAVTNAAILIQGETGVGKEVLAQAIHRASPRAQYPFVAINCAALPESLLESELFGYEEGAFTGARRGGKPGLFEQAHRGTIFLDEIGDVSPALQARLLRVLELHEVLRVGGTQVIPIEIRVIAATNRNLVAMVSQGQFRADLFYRLNVLPLTIPPLRQRQGDIGMLFRLFLHSAGYRGQVDPAVDRLLTAYPWPGNLRELRNCAEYALVMSTGGLVQPGDLPETLRAGARSQAPPAYGGRPGAEELSPDLRFLLEAIARVQAGGKGLGRRTLARLAAEAGWNLSEAEIRLRLRRLADLGLVSQERGRAGTELTPAGWERAGLTRR